MTLKRILTSLLSGMALIVSISMGRMEADARSGGESERVQLTDGGYSYADNLVYANDFEEGIGDAEILITGLKAYEKGIEYGAGRTGRAVRLGEYGLKLGQKNLGSNYTVSVWVRPDGVVAGNSPVIFLGYHSPEKWAGISGHNASTCKVWVNSDTVTHSTIDYVEQSPREWTMLTMTGDGETFTIYQNGKKVAAANSEAAKVAVNALSGSNQDVYLGVNYWDDEFKGFADDVRIYNRALGEAEIAELYTADIEGMFSVNGALRNEVLGDGNLSAEAVKYDLHLPAGTAGTDIVWSSSKPQIVSSGGVVSNGVEDTAVTLTGELANGKSITFTVTVKALDKSGLRQQIAQAEAIDTTYYTEESIENLNAAVKYAQNVTSQKMADRATERLEYAIKSLAYIDEYTDPWTMLEDAVPAKSIQIYQSSSDRIFRIPESIAKMVDVEYISSAPKIVSYAGGIVKGLKEGRAVVTTKVAAKYDGWTVCYPTIVTVTKRETKTDLSGVTAKTAKSVMEKGKTVKITVKYPSKADVKVKYTSSGAVSVTNKGVIKGKKTGSGKVTITFTATDGAKATRTIHMKVGAISGKSSMKTGRKLSLKVAGILGKAEWSVDKKSLGKISPKGVLTAKKKGVITVKAKIQGITLQKKITIKK